MFIVLEIKMGIIVEFKETTPGSVRSTILFSEIFQLLD